MEMNYRSMVEQAKKAGVTNEKTMWESIESFSELLEELKESHPDLYWDFMRKQHGIMYNGHYDEAFAMWQIEQMYYKDKTGEKHHSPRWSRQQYKIAYDMNKLRLRNQAINMWDFAVALEMIASDNHCLYKTWWPDINDVELDKKFIDAAVNYLNDDDDLDEGKIWDRFNG